MNTIDLVVVISLTIFAISFLLLVVSLIPLLIQLVKLLEVSSDVLKIMRDEIVPQFSKFSTVIGGAGEIAQKGKDLGSKLTRSVFVAKDVFKAALEGYFSKVKKK